MMRRTVVRAALALAALGSVAPAVRAQQGGQRTAIPRPLTAFAHANLTFGTVLPGVPAQIRISDLLHTALFEIQGPEQIPVRIEFLLPPHLVSETGAELPLSFGAGDGFANFSRDPPPFGIVFSPHAPLVTTLGARGTLWVRLGGTALPNRPQPRGVYRATIYLSIYSLAT